MGANQVTFILIVAISVLTGVLFEPPPPLTKKQLLRTIHANATRSSEVVPRSAKVAVGTNVCIDLIASADDFFAGHFADEVPTRSELATDEAPSSATIKTDQELVDAFSYFFARGAAAERYVEPELFAKLVQSAGSLESTTKRLGGNAALMGNKMAALGHPILFSGPDNADLRELVSERVTFSEKAGTNPTETHIILEYSVGDSFQGISSDRANRLILTPDSTPSTETLKAWITNIAQQNPPVSAIVFSGLHQFESSSEDVWRPYLATAKEALATIESIPRHLELASLSNEALTKDIIVTLFSTVESIGFNEEELSALFYALGGSYDDLPSKICNPRRDAEARRHRILRWNIVKRAIKIFQLEDMLEEIDPPNIPPCLQGKSPDVSAVSAALDYVLRAAKQRTGSIVSRMHFHSLGYHIIATATDSSREWPRVLEAAASGSTAATYQACNVSGHEDLHGDDLKLVSPTKLDVVGDGSDIRSISKSEAIHVWRSENLEFNFVPVLVCKEPVGTVGLGDAISATAFRTHLGH